MKETANHHRQFNHEKQASRTLCSQELPEPVTRHPPSCWLTSKAPAPRPPKGHSRLPRGHSRLILADSFRTLIRYELIDDPLRCLDEERTGRSRIDYSSRELLDSGTCEDCGKSSQHFLDGEDRGWAASRLCLWDCLACSRPSRGWMDWWRSQQWSSKPWTCANRPLPRQIETHVLCLTISDLVMLALVSFSAINGTFGWKRTPVLVPPSSSKAETL